MIQESKNSKERVAMRKNDSFEEECDYIVDSNTHSPLNKEKQGYSNAGKREPQRFSGASSRSLFLLRQISWKVGHFKSLTPLCCFDIEQQEGPRTVE
mmetsp:Transcript_5820/g.6477  ORF Transcript_5820/g.6477 Transcript_5820/m.6477 type:complete len:97 (-) Transcript_5820:1839-2129(-)